MSETGLAELPPPGVSDLALTAVIVPGGPLVPSSVQTLVLTITNNGPSDARLVFAASDIYVEGGLGALARIEEIPETAPCAFTNFVELDPLPGGPVYASAMAGVQQLPAHQSVSCSVGISAWRGARGSLDLGFTIQYDPRASTDPDLSDNRVVLSLQFEGPAPIPALDDSASTALIGGVLLLALVALRRTMAEPAV